MRTKEGAIIGDPVRFPEGMKAFIAKLHDMGFKFGLCKQLSGHQPRALAPSDARTTLCKMAAPPPASPSLENMSACICRSPYWTAMLLTPATPRGADTDIGPNGCHHPFVGSFGHYQQDALTFQSWGWFCAAMTRPPFP